MLYRSDPVRRLYRSRTASVSSMGLDGGIRLMLKIDEGPRKLDVISRRVFRLRAIEVKLRP
jgi:hypothetical protein